MVIGGIVLKVNSPANSFWRMVKKITPAIFDLLPCLRHSRSLAHRKTCNLTECVVLRKAAGKIWTIPNYF